MCYTHEAKIMNRRLYHSRRRRAGAFTMVECLIALAISAVLLTAVAVAFNASVVNYRENEKMYWTMNSARQALTRMTSQLRTASIVDLTAPSTQCNFFTGDTPAQDLTYEFRAADNKLYLITNSNGSEYVLCDNVTAAAFWLTPTDDGMDCKSIQMSITVRDGDFERTLSAAAVVRKNLTF